MLLAAEGAPAEWVTYRLDPTHSFVYAEVDHFGASTIRIRFGPVQGEVELDRHTDQGRIDIVVATTSASSGVPPFDARLREPDLLAVDQHPQARFVAERFVFERFSPREVRGSLTLRGTTKPLVLRASRFGCYPSPVLVLREVCGGDFEGELRRSEFGIDFGLPLVRDLVRLKIQVEGIRQQPSGTEPGR
jgi:polyisoprenoid-binding protein YceI